MWQYLFSGQLLGGAWITLELAVAAQAMGIVLGVIAALSRQSRSVFVRWPAQFYVWFFRGTPVLVQIYFWFVGFPQLFPGHAPGYFGRRATGIGH